MHRLGLALPFAAALALGCGSDPAKPQPGTTAAPLTCDAESFADSSLPDLDVGTVTATVLDADDAAAEGAEVEVCGVILCTKPKFADESGAVAVDVGVSLQKPALKYGDGLEFGELAVLLADGAGDVDFGVVHTPRLPEGGAPVAPGTSTESAGVTLTLARDASVTLDDTLPPYDTPDSRGFRAAELPAALWPAGLTHGAELELIFTLAPLGAELCPPAELRVPNSLGWDAGTAVEFLVQGFGVGVGEHDQPYAPYGEWQAVATGVVDEGGTELVTTSGGLPIISNVGVRRL